MACFEFNYIKDNNCNRFNDLLNVKNIQNYNPIYKLFFKLTDNNYNTVQLNERFKLKNINQRISHSVFDCTLDDTLTNTQVTKKMFIKFSPLIDPTKYLIGKFDIHRSNIYIAI